MIITIVAGPGEGKSGMACWLSEQLSKYGASVIIHDNEITADNMAEVRENYEKITKYVAKTQQVHVVTRLRPKSQTDANILTTMKKSGVFAA